VLDLAGTTRLRFATLTLKASDQVLKERLEFLRSSFSRLRKTALWKRSVTAGVACLEVKRYKTVGGWHCHYHLLFHGRYIVRTELARTWKAITGDSDVVDVRLAKSRKNVARYVVKYASKPLDTTYVGVDALLDEAVVALKGVRLVDTFGAWRGQKLTATEPDGEWVDIGTLDYWLLRAYQGDSEANVLLASLRSTATEAGLTAASEWSPSVQPQPPPPVPTTGCLFPEAMASERYFSHVM